MMDSRQPSRDETLKELLEQLQAASAASRAAQRAETNARRAVVAEARRQALPLREIGKLMGLSHQRVAKIERDLHASTSERSG